MLRLRLLVPLLAAPLLLAAVCSDGDGASERGAPASVATATPASLGVTPVTPDFPIRDPAFEAKPGARAYYGTYSGGAYRIEVPDGWNGDLVLWAHGFRGFGGELFVDMPFAMRDYLIASGYAWAASSYRANGYVPGYGAQDTIALKRLFEEQVGKPERTYLIGGSMGGHITVLSLERAPEEYDGAVALCGVMSGVEILDFFVSWGAVAGYLTGVDMTGYAGDPDGLARAFKEEVLPKLSKPGALTEAGRRFESVITHLSGGPRPFRAEGFEDRYDENFELVIASLAARSVAIPVAGNVGYTYEIDPGLGVTSEELNAGVPRVAADEDGRRNSEFGEYMPVSGQIEDPLVAIHNTGDFFVPFSLELSYRERVIEAGNEDLLVQRAIRRSGHCNFTPEEVRMAFEDLVRWVEDGVRPEGDDLAGDLRDAGLEFTIPLEPNDPGGF